MNDQDSWYGRDAFWELFETVLFNEQRRLRTTEEVDRIINLLQIEEGARILDLCCGTGRHSLELSRRGYDITGVDRTTAYINKARSEAQRSDLEAQFVVGDMREFLMSNSFDVVLNLFGSFGYFEDPEDDRQVAAHMHASLRPGGRFMIETQGKEILAREFQEKEWSEEGDLLILSERKVSQNWGRIETRWIVIRGTERFEHQVSVRSYAAVELASLLSDCGFSEVRVYGNLDGVAYDQAAQRLVVVGSK